MQKTKTVVNTDTRTPLMYVDTVSGEVQCALGSGLAQPQQPQQQQPILLGGKTKGDDAEKKEKKKKDKKDKTGIKKHKDKKKHKKHHHGEKKKKEKNVGKAVVAEVGGTDEHKRLQKTIAEAAEKRARLMKAAEEARLEEEALRSKLEREQQQQNPPQRPSIFLTIEDSEDEEERQRVKKEKEVEVVEQMTVEEKTTDSSSTVPKSTNPPPSPFIDTAGTDATVMTGPVKQLNRLQLTNALKKLHAEFTFLASEANVYKQYGVKDADALHSSAQQSLSLIAQQQSFIAQNKKLGTPQMDTISSIVARQQASMDALVKRFKAAKFGGFRYRLIEWEMEQRVAHIAAKKNSVPALNKHVLAHLAEVQEKLGVLRRRAYEREGGGYMQVEGKNNTNDIVATETSKKQDREERLRLHGQLKNLLSVANDDKSGVLSLYNQTHDALATLGQLVSDVKARYEQQGRSVPEGLLEKLRELDAKIVLIDKAWDRREKYVASVVDPRKDKKDEIMKDVVTELPLIQALLSETIDTAMMVEVKPHKEIPPRVITNPYKLFVEFNAKKSSRVQLLTKDQKGNQLNANNQNALDIQHIKEMAFTVNDGLYLAPSQFPNPHSVNGVYAAQDISKNQLITFCMGRPTKVLPPQRAGQLRPSVQLFYGVPLSGVPHWYLMLDEDVAGRTEDTGEEIIHTISSDHEELVTLPGDEYYSGAGGLIHDCLNVAQYRQHVANRQVLVVTGGGGGGRGNTNLDIEEERSEDLDEEESSMDMLGGLGSSDMRPTVPDTELNVMNSNINNNNSGSTTTITTSATRPVTNCRFQIYHDEYNELIRDLASKEGGEDFLVLLDPAHSIVVVEATRTIRRGEELFIKFDDYVWDHYINGYDGAPNNGLPRGVQEVGPGEVGVRSGLSKYLSHLRKALASELTRQSRIDYPIDMPLPIFSAAHVEPYQAPDNEDDVDEEKEKKSGDSDDSEGDYSDGSDGDMVPEDDAHWYGSDGDDEEDEEDEEGEEESYDEEAAIEGVRKDLAKLTKKIKPDDTRQSDIGVVRQLLDNIELRGDQMSDEQYRATFTEMLVRAARVVEDSPFFALENGFYRGAINKFSGQLDKNTEKYKLYIEFHSMRKKIEQLRVTDAVNDNENNKELIEQLIEERERKYASLADAAAEAEVEGM